MQTVSVDQVKPGMILAKPIIDDKNRVIVTEGAALTAMHVKRLERWGIKQVFVQDPPPPPAAASVGTAPSEAAAAPEKAQAPAQATVQEPPIDPALLARIEEMFSSFPDDQRMLALKRFAVRNLAAGKKDGPGEKHQGTRGAGGTRGGA